MSDSLRPHRHSPPDSSVHRILQARILEWVAIPFSRGLPNPGNEPVSLTFPRTTWEDPSYTILLFSCSVMSNSLRHHGLQLALPPCLSLSPRVCSNVHWVDNAIQPSQPLLPPSPPTFNPTYTVSFLKSDTRKIYLHISNHRTGKGQFSFQSQRRAMPKDVQTATQLHSSHMIAK